MDVVAFWPSFLSAVSTFLMTPPINGFVGVLILSLIVGLFFKIIGGLHR